MKPENIGFLRQDMQSHLLKNSTHLICPKILISLKLQGQSIMEVISLEGAKYQNLGTIEGHVAGCISPYIILRHTHTNRILRKKK